MFDRLSVDAVRRKIKVKPHKHWLKIGNMPCRYTEKRRLASSASTASCCIALRNNVELCISLHGDWSSTLSDWDVEFARFSYKVCFVHTLVEDE